MHARCKKCGLDLTIQYCTPYCDDCCPIQDGVVAVLKYSKVKYKIISGKSSQNLTKIMYIKNGMEIEVPTRELWSHTKW